MLTRSVVAHICEYSKAKQNKTKKPARVEGGEEFHTGHQYRIHTARF